jgi:hypothetical protein
MLTLIYNLIKIIYSFSFSSVDGLTNCFGLLFPYATQVKTSAQLNLSRRQGKAHTPIIQHP